MTTCLFIGGSFSASESEGEPGYFSVTRKNRFPETTPGQVHVVLPPAAAGNDPAGFHWIRSVEEDTS